MVDATAAAPVPEATFGELVAGLVKLLVANFVAGITLPTVVLFVLLVSMAYMLRSIQRREDFDFANMLRDDTGAPNPLGKESFLRLAGVGSFAFSSWTIMDQGRSHPPLDNTLFAIYCITWSGAIVFLKAAEKWDGRLPWAKGSP